MLKDKIREQVQENPLTNPTTIGTRLLLKSLITVDNEPLDNEINQYLVLEPADLAQYDGVLDFWAKNQGRFPTVARFASKILCIMASSSSAERAFSALNRTATKERNSLDKKTVENLIAVINIEKFNNMKAVKK